MFRRYGRIKNEILGHALGIPIVISPLKKFGCHRLVKNDDMQGAQISSRSLRVSLFQSCY